MTFPGFWTEGGQFAQDNRRLILQQSGLGYFSNVHYLFPQGGGPRGSYSSFTSGVRNQLRSRDVVVIGGVVREQVVMPEDVYDITFLGAANVPRQATDGGVPTGGGATWMAPASPTALTPLIEFVRQGCSVRNLLFNPVASSAAIRLTTAGGLDEAGQFSMLGCSVLGGGEGQIGIEDNGGSGFVIVDGSDFQLLTGTAILGLTTANAVPLSWRISNSNFRQNTNDIKMSLRYALIELNRFFTAGSGSTNKVIDTIALSGQGEWNQVRLNQFPNVAAEVKNNNGYRGSTTDLWNNYVLETAALIIESPPAAS